MNWSPVWKQIGWKHVGKSLLISLNVSWLPPAAVVGAAALGAAALGAAALGAAAVAGAAEGGAAVGAVVALDEQAPNKRAATVARAMARTRIPHPPHSPITRRP
jgi:hypothetical protein